MRKIVVRCAFLVAATLAGVPVRATAQAVVPTTEEQVRLALTAAPAHLRSEATVHVLDEDGYRVARQGTNGFHCLLERWDPEVLVPICYDRVGAESTLLATFELETLRARRLPEDEVMREIDRRYEEGRLKAPAGQGVAYMLSTEAPAPPHVMYYAP